jgi:long-chain acyl-CoA synthetase
MNLASFLFDNVKDSENTFILGQSEDIRFNDLYKNVGKTARFLCEEHPGEERLLLVADNSLLWITAYLAIIKGNKTVIPIDPRLEPEQITRIIDICGINRVILQDKYRAVVAARGNVQIIDEETLSRIYQIPDFEDSEPVTNLDCVAVILVTSGSTGSKKLVMLTHGNIIANTESILAYLEITSNDRIEVVLPFFYCYGTSLLHTHLRAGGQMVLNNNFRFPSTVINDLEKYNCTGFAGVPSHFQILLKRTDICERSFKHLRYFTQAGGKLANHFIEQMDNAFPHVKFIVMYGATEATARLSYLPPDKSRQKLGSIGKGISGVRLEVLNETGDPVDVGETGEIVASGDNIMKGYFNEPEETREVLRNGKLYTGDLATVDEDGFIFVTGRKSQIIKSGGTRVSVAEIEEKILQIDKITKAHVTYLADDISGEAIVALVELEHNSSLDAKKLNKILMNKLPLVKLPKRIIITKIPVSSSGKIQAAEIKKIITEVMSQD